MYIIAEMTKSSKVRQAMSELGWESHVDPINQVYISVPKDPSTFLTIPSYTYEGSATAAEEDVKLPPVQDSEIQNKILKEIIVLANPVTEVSASNNLKKYRSQYKKEFTKSDLVFKIYYYLNKYRYSLQARALVHQLLSECEFTAQDFDYLDANF